MSLISTNANIQVNEWNHVSFTYNKVSSNVNLYLNGSNIANSNLKIDLTSTIDDIFIGYNSNLSGKFFFDGSIDEILLFDRELTSNEIANLVDYNRDNFFLENKLVGYWTFDEFKTHATTFIDNSVNNNEGVSVGNVQYGTKVMKGNHSIAFDGNSRVDISNNSLHSDYMSIGCWVKPTTINTKIISKQDVFSLEINQDALPELKIGNVSTSDSKLILSAKSEIVENKKAHFQFENNLKDSTNINSDAITTDTTFEPSFNQLGKICLKTQSNTSKINFGKLVQNVSNPNQMTFSTWINMTDLSNYKDYSIFKLKNGFDFFLRNNNNGNKSLCMNYYQVPSDLSVNLFEFTANTANISFTINTNRDIQYSAIIFPNAVDHTIQEVQNKIKTLSTSFGTISGSFVGTETINITLDHVMTYTGQRYDLETINKGYLYICLKGDNLNSDIFLESTHHTSLTHHTLFKNVQIDLSKHLKVSTVVFNAYESITSLFIAVFHPDFNVSTLSNADLVQFLENQTSTTTAMKKTTNIPISNIVYQNNSFTHAFINNTGELETIVSNVAFDILIVLIGNDIAVESYSGVIDDLNQTIITESTDITADGIETTVKELENYTIKTITDPISGNSDVEITTTEISQINSTFTLDVSYDTIDQEDFIYEFKLSYAENAKVTPNEVIVNSITAGSVVVDASITVIDKLSYQDIVVNMNEPTKIFSEDFKDKYSISDVAANNVSTETYVSTAKVNEVIVDGEKQINLEYVDKSGNTIKSSLTKETTGTVKISSTDASGVENVVINAFDGTTTLQTITTSDDGTTTIENKTEEGQAINVVQLSSPDENTGLISVTTTDSSGNVENTVQDAQGNEIDFKLELLSDSSSDNTNNAIESTTKYGMIYKSVLTNGDTVYADSTHDNDTTISKVFNGVDPTDISWFQISDALKTNNSWKGSINQNLAGIYEFNGYKNISKLILYNSHDINNLVGNVVIEYWNDLEFVPVVNQSVVGWNELSDAYLLKEKQLIISFNTISTNKLKLTLISHVNSITNQPSISLLKIYGTITSSISERDEFGNYTERVVKTDGSVMTISKNKLDNVISTTYEFFNISSDESELNYNLTAVSTTLYDMSYEITLNNGDKVYFDSLVDNKNMANAFVGFKPGIENYDAMTDLEKESYVWKGNTPLSGIYVFNNLKFISKISLYNTYSIENIVGNVDIFYWNNSSFVAVRNKNVNGWNLNANNNVVAESVLNIQFDRIITDKIKIVLHSHPNATNNLELALTSMTIYDMDINIVYPILNGVVQEAQLQPDGSRIVQLKENDLVIDTYISTITTENNVITDTQKNVNTGEIIQRIKTNVDGTNISITTYTDATDGSDNIIETIEFNDKSKVVNILDSTRTNTIKSTTITKPNSFGITKEYTLNGNRVDVITRNDNGDIIGTSFIIDNVETVVETTDTTIQEITVVDDTTITITKDITDPSIILKENTFYALTGINVEIVFEENNVKTETTTTDNKSVIVRIVRYENDVETLITTFDGVGNILETTPLSGEGNRIEVLKLGTDPSIILKTTTYTNNAIVKIIDNDSEGNVVETTFLSNGKKEITTDVDTSDVLAIRIYDYSDTLTLLQEFDENRNILETTFHSDSTKTTVLKDASKLYEIVRRIEYNEDDSIKSTIEYNEDGTITETIPLYNDTIRVIERLANNDIISETLTYLLTGDIEVSLPQEGGNVKVQYIRNGIVLNEKLYDTNNTLISNIEFSELINTETIYDENGYTTERIDNITGNSIDISTYNLNNRIISKTEYINASRTEITAYNVNDNTRVKTIYIDDIETQIVYYNALNVATLMIMKYSDYVEEIQLNQDASRVITTKRNDIMTNKDLYDTNGVLYEAYEYYDTYTIEINRQPDGTYIARYVDPNGNVTDTKYLNAERQEIQSNVVNGSEVIETKNANGDIISTTTITTKPEGGKTHVIVYHIDNSTETKELNSNNVVLSSVLRDSNDNITKQITYNTSGSTVETIEEIFSNNNKIHTITTVSTSGQITSKSKVSEPDTTTGYITTTNLLTNVATVRNGDNVISTTIYNTNNDIVSITTYDIDNNIVLTVPNLGYNLVTTTSPTTNKKISQVKVNTNNVELLRIEYDASEREVSKIEKNTNNENVKTTNTTYTNSQIQIEEIFYSTNVINYTINTVKANDIIISQYKVSEPDTNGYITTRNLLNNIEVVKNGDITVSTTTYDNLGNIVLISSFDTDGNIVETTPKKDGSKIVITKDLGTGRTISKITLSDTDIELINITYDENEEISSIIEKNSLDVIIKTTTIETNSTSGYKETTVEYYLDTNIDKTIITIMDGDTMVSSSEKSSKDNEGFYTITSITNATNIRTIETYLLDTLKSTKTIYPPDAQHISKEKLEVVGSSIITEKYFTNVDDVKTLLETHEINGNITTITYPSGRKQITENIDADGTKKITNIDDNGNIIDIIDISAVVQGEYTELITKADGSSVETVYHSDNTKTITRRNTASEIISIESEAYTLNPDGSTERVVNDNTGNPIYTIHETVKDSQGNFTRTITYVDGTPTEVIKISGVNNNQYTETIESLDGSKVITTKDSQNNIISVNNVSPLTDTGYTETITFNSNNIVHEIVYNGVGDKVLSIKDSEGVLTKKIETSAKNQYGSYSEKTTKYPENTSVEIQYNNDKSTTTISRDSENNIIEQTIVSAKQLNGSYTITKSDGTNTLSTSTIYAKDPNGEYIEITEYPDGTTKEIKYKNDGGLSIINKSGDLITSYEEISPINANGNQTKVIKDKDQNITSTTIIYANKNRKVTYADGSSQMFDPDGNILGNTTETSTDTDGNEVLTEKNEIGEVISITVIKTIDAISLTEMNFSVRETSPNNTRIDLMEVQLLDSQDNLIPFTATLYGTMSSGRDNPLFLSDGYKYDGSGVYKGLTWVSSTVGDELVKLTGDFANVDRIRLFHFRQTSGPSWDIKDQDGVLIAQTTTLPDTTADVNTIEEQIASGQFQISPIMNKHPLYDNKIPDTNNAVELRIYLEQIQNNQFSALNSWNILLFNDETLTDKDEASVNTSLRVPYTVSYTTPNVVNNLTGTFAWDVPWNYTATTWFVPTNTHTNSQVLLKLSTTDDVKRIVFIHSRVMYVASYRFEIWKDGVKVDEKINTINANDSGNGAGYGTNTDIKYAYNAGAFASVVFDSIPKADTPIIWHNYDYRINDIILSLKPTYEDAFTKLKTIRTFYSKLAYGPSFDIFDHKFNLITHTPRVENYDDIGSTIDSMITNNQFIVGTTDFDTSITLNNIQKEVKTLSSDDSSEITLSLNENKIRHTTFDANGNKTFEIFYDANGKIESSIQYDASDGGTQTILYKKTDVNTIKTTINKDVSDNEIYRLIQYSDLNGKTIKYEEITPQDFGIQLSVEPAELRIYILEQLPDEFSQTLAWELLLYNSETSIDIGESSVNTNLRVPYEVTYTTPNIGNNFSGNFTWDVPWSSTTVSWFKPAWTHSSTEPILILSTTDDVKRVVIVHSRVMYTASYRCELWRNNVKIAEGINTLNPADASNGSGYVDGGSVQVAFENGAYTSTILTTVSDLVPTKYYYISSKIQLSVKQVSYNAYYSSGSTLCYGENTIISNGIQLVSKSTSNNWTGNSAAYGVVLNLELDHSLTYRFKIEFNDETYARTWQNVFGIMIGSSQNAIYLSGGYHYVAVYHAYAENDIILNRSGDSVSTDTIYHYYELKIVNNIPIINVYPDETYSTLAHSFTYPQSTDPMTENPLKSVLIYTGFTKSWGEEQTRKYRTLTISDLVAVDILNIQIFNYISNNSTKHKLLSLENYEKSSFANDSQAIDLNNVIVDLTNTNFTLSLRGPSNSWSFIKLNDTIIDMYIGNIYTFDMYMTQNTLSARYGGMVFGHDFPMHSKVQDNPSPAAINWNFEIDANDASWKHYHNNFNDIIWKNSDKEGLGTETNDSGISTINEAFVRYWKLTVIKHKNDKKDILIEGFSNIERTILKYWTYVSYLGNYPNNDIQYLQHDTIHFGIVHGSGVGTNEYTVLENVIAHNNGRKSILPSKGLYTITYNNNESIYDLYGNLIQSADKTEIIVNEANSPPTFSGSYPASFLDLTSVDGTTNNSIYPNKGTTEFSLIENDRTANFDKSLDESVLDILSGLIQLPTWNQSLVGAFNITLSENSTILLGSEYGRSTNYGRPFLKHVFGVSDDQITVINGHGWIAQSGTPWAESSPMVWQSIPVAAGTYNITNTAMDLLESNKYNWMIMGIGYTYINQNVITYSDNSKVITDNNLDESKTITSYSPDNYITDVRTITPKTTVDTITTFTTSIQKYSFTLIDNTKSIDSKVLPQGSITFSGSYPASFLDLTSLDGTTNNSIYPNKGTTEFILMENDRTANFNKSLNESVLDILSGLIQLPTWNQSLVGAFDITLSENSTILLGSENGRSTNFGRPFLKHVFGVSDDQITVINGHGWIGQSGTPWAETSPMVWQSIPVAAGTYNITTTAMDILDSNNYNWMIMGVGYIDNNSYQLLKNSVIITEVDSNNESLTKETITVYDKNDTILENTVVETTKNNDNTLTIVKQPVETLFKLEYNADGPVSNFDYINLIGTDVKYVLENDKYVAEYGTTKGSDNASINATVHELKFVAPDRDFLIDIIFKTPSNALAERHSLFAITSDSNTYGFQVYTPNGETGYQASTWPWDSPARFFFINQGGWTPALNQYGRYTFIFRKSTNKLEVLLNGAKDIPIANNTNYNWSSVSNNIIDIIDQVNFFGKEVSIKIGHGRDQAYTNATTYLRFESCYVKTFDIPETPISTIDTIPTLPYEYNISTSTINQDGSSVEIIKDDQNNIISTTTTSAVDSTGNIIISTTNSDNTSSEITKNKDGTTTVNKDSYGNIVNTITSTPPNEFGYITQTIVNSDNSSSVIMTDKFESTTQTIQTTTVSAPDQDGNITETTSKLDGSESIVIKDSSNNITQTTTISVPDEDGNTTEIITSADGLETTIIKDSSDNTIQSTSVSTPDQDGNTTETSIIDGITTTIIKDNSGTIVQTSSTDVDNNITETTYNDDQTKSVEVKNSSGSIIQTSTISVPDQNDYKTKISYDVLSETPVVQSTFPPKYTNTFWTTKTMFADGSDKLFWVNTYDNITYEIYGSSYRENEEPYRVFSRNIDHTTERIANYEINYTDTNQIHAWHSDNETWDNITAIIKISEPINIQSYYFRARHYTSYTQRPSKWNIYVSNDSTTWIQIDSRDNEANNYTLNTVKKFDAPSYEGYYHWVKIVVHDQDNGWWSQSDWRFDGTYVDKQQTITFLDYNDAEISYQPFPSKYTNAGWQSKTMYADGGNKLFWFNTYDNITYEIYGNSYRSGEEPYRVFSRNINTHEDYETNNGSVQIHAWHSNTDAWTTIEAIIKVSAAINIQSYYFRARHYTSPTQRPSKWSIYVSNDSDTWIEIDSRDNEAANYTLDAIRKFNAPHYQGYYKWIKIVVYNQNNTWWSQSDWRFDGSTEILDLNEYKLLHIDFSQDTIFDASKHSRSFVENTMGTTTINGIKAGQTNSGSQHILIDGVGDSQLVSWDFSVVLVLELGAKLGSWDNFFLWQWRVGWSIKDNMFILGSVMKRDGDATTSPDWRFEGNKVILVAKHNQSNMTFNIYRLSDGYMYSTNTRTVTPSMISYIQNYTVGEHSTNTSGREIIIGAGFYYEPESSWREGANAKYGEVIFLNTHLDDTQESNMVSQFVAKWNTRNIQSIINNDNTTTDISYFNNIIDGIAYFDTEGNLSAPNKLEIKVVANSFHSTNRILLNQLQLIDENGDLIPYNATIHGNPNTTNQHTISDGVKFYPQPYDGSSNSGIIWDVYSIGDILITLEGFNFDKITKIRFFHYRPSVGPSWEVFDIYGNSLGDPTTPINDTNAGATSIQTMSDRGEYQEIITIPITKKVYQDEFKTLHIKVNGHSYHSAQRISLCELRILDNNNNIIPYIPSILGTTYYTNVLPYHTISDGLKLFDDGSASAIIWDTASIGDILITLKGHFNTASKIRFYHFRPSVGPSWMAYTENEIALGNATTAINDTNTGATSINTMDERGEYQEIVFRDSNGSLIYN